MDEEAPLKYKFENDETRLKTDTGKSIQIFVHNNNKPLSSKYLALIKKKEVRKPLLGTFDTLVSLFLISTCVVGVWRGVWVLLEIYDDYVPAWMCLSVGLCTYIVFIIVQDSLNDIVKKKSSTTESKIFNFLITRTYTSIFAVSSIMYWRGGWAFMDKYLNVELTKSGTVLKKGSGVMLTVCAGCLLLIMALRSLRNCVAPPFLFCTDRKSKTFVILTRFRTKYYLLLPQPNTSAPTHGCCTLFHKMRGSTAGLPETLRVRHNAQYYAVLSILDTLFSSLVVAPLVIGYWRSVWELMGVYVYPEDELLSACISTGLGIVGHLFFTLLQRLFERYLHPDRGRILFYVMSRVYTVCFAFVCVNGWRGPWLLLAMFTKNELWSILTPFIVGIVALAAMRGLRNASAAPFAVVLDTAKGYFEVPTMFRVAMSERTSLYILDCLFSVLIVGTLVVFVWRGAWALVDIYLFPESEKWSAWGSLIVGYCAVAIAFLLQPFMKWLCDRITGVSRVLVADLFLILSLVGTVNVWRGIWNLLNLYLLPDNLELSCWLTHWVSLTLLILLGCSNSLLVRGVSIDAEEPAGKCVVFPCYYLRLIFHEQKLKKLQSEQNKTELDNVKPCENNHVVNEQYPQTLQVNHKVGDV